MIAPPPSDEVDPEVKVGVMYLEVHVAADDRISLPPLEVRVACLDEIVFVLHLLLCPGFRSNKTSEAVDGPLKPYFENLCIHTLRLLLHGVSAFLAGFCVQQNFRGWG
jgi:hypothetical protein